MRTASVRLGGQDSGGPSGVLDQSSSATPRAISRSSFGRWDIDRGRSVISLGRHDDRAWAHLPTLGPGARRLGSMHARARAVIRGGGGHVRPTTGPATPPRRSTGRSPRHPARRRCSTSGAGTGKVTEALPAAARRARHGGGARRRDARRAPRRLSPPSTPARAPPSRSRCRTPRWTPSSSARRGTGSTGRSPSPRSPGCCGPGGVLVVLWNGDDDTVEWVRGYQRALHPRGAGAESAPRSPPPSRATRRSARPRRAGSPTRCPPRSTASSRPSPRTRGR